MSRGKVKIAFIFNNSRRKTTFRKRKNGLLKKAKEISTLCGVRACAIIYSPYTTDPEVWPSNDGVRRVIDEFKALPEIDQQKKMFDQETFLRQRIMKETNKLTAIRKENRELEMTEVMFHCLKGEMENFNLNLMDLNDLGYVIDKNLKCINRRREILLNPNMEIGESSNAAHAETGTTGEGDRTIPVVTVGPTTPTNMVFDGGSSSSSAAIPAFFNPIQPHQYQLQPQLNSLALVQAQYAHAQPHAPYAHAQDQQAQAYAYAHAQAPTQVQALAQEFYYPSAPNISFLEQYRNLNLSENQDQIQQQSFMEMMNHPEMSQTVGQMRSTFMDENHHQQHPLIPNDSSTPSASTSPNPATDLNLTNNPCPR